MTDDDRRALIAGLRSAASQAVELVAEASQLPNAPAAADGPVLVIDRPGVARANLTVMKMVLDQVSAESPVLASLELGNKAMATGIGLVLAVISTRVMGQYEPFSQRLLLCAPNVVQVSQQIKAKQDDFVLWVALHEQTHRHQFAAAPWLRGRMLELIGQVIQLDDGTIRPNLANFGRGIRQPEQDLNLGLSGALASPEMSLVLGKVTAMMSLLEGYADMLMDTAGVAAIPSLSQIRRAFDDRRRQRQRGVRGVIEKALGFSAKISQYTDGKSFCQAVVRQVGLAGLNQAFAAPENLPTVDELHNPEQWVKRCLPSTDDAKGQYEDFSGAT